MVFPKKRRIKEAIGSLPLIGWGFLPFLLLMLAVGCTRGQYRRAADADAYSLVAEASSASMHSQIPGYTIEVDPASRMFDPFCPDCPPMPPDDPVSHRAMHCVDGKPGYPCWHANGDTVCVESPAWSFYLPLDEAGSLITDRKDAVKLGLIHSPAYQEEREKLYLSALDVSLEQFSFDTQLFGGYASTYTANGRVRGGGDDSSLLDLSTRGVRARKLFASGGELVVGFANTLLWQFSSDNSHTATTLIDFAFIQPLLREGGRDVVLESLTQAERDLLADVRSFERFRRSFLLDITLGGTNPGGVSGYFGLLRDQQIIQNQESNIIALQNSLAQLEAFFNAGRIDSFQVELTRQALFQAQSGLLNRRANYDRQLDNYKITLGLPPQLDLIASDPMLSPLELIDTEMASLDRELVRLQSAMGNTIDAIFSEEIRSPQEGLPLLNENSEEEAEQIAERSANNEPANIQLAMASDPLPTLSSLELQPPQRDPLPLEQQDGEAPDEEENADEPLHQAEQDQRQHWESQLRWSEDLARQLQILRDQLDTLNSIQQELTTNSLPRTRQKVEQYQAGLENQHEEIEPLHPDVELPNPPANLDTSERLALNLDNLNFFTSEDAAALTQSLDDVEAHLLEVPNKIAAFQEAIDLLLIEGPEETPANLYARVVEGIALPASHLLVEIASDRLEITLAMARARIESISLTPIDIDPETAYCVAQVYRRDWMNARAELVDQWRAIQLRANDLESDLDVVFHGDIGNTGDNPFRLRSVNGRLQVGLEFDSPLTREAERNAYRSAQINYQQARREYYAFEDEASRSLRDILRQIGVNRRNLELQKGAVHVAIKQVDLALLRLQEPPQPGESGQFGATTARDLVQALSSLLNAQNDYVNTWVSYESLRQILDYEMGTMQLDSEGRWIDPGPVYDEQWEREVGAACNLCRPPFVQESPNHEAIERNAQQDLR